MLIDLHARTKASVPAVPDPEKVISAAQAAGLDGVAFVDRLHSAGANKLIELGKEADFPVFVGVEIPTTMGRFLCFTPEVDPFLSREEWRQLMAVEFTPTYTALSKLFEGLGGAILAAQPYAREKGMRLGDSLVLCDGLHGVEVTTANTSLIDRALAIEAAVKIGLPTTAGSELTRTSSEVGRAATLFTNRIVTQRDLVDALRGGDFWGVELGKRGDTARRARPRQKPSDDRTDRRDNRGRRPRRPRREGDRRDRR